MLRFLQIFIRISLLVFCFLHVTHGVDKDKIRAKPSSVVGLSGTYGAVSKVSTRGVIEAEHIIPSAVYRDTTNPDYKHIPRREQGAVSMLYGDHRKHATTGSSGAAKKFREDLVREANAGNTPQVIRSSLGKYPPEVVKGSGGALNVFEAQKLITRDQNKGLRKEFGIPSDHSDTGSDGERRPAKTEIRKSTAGALDKFKSRSDPSGLSSIGHTSTSTFGGSGVRPATPGSSLSHGPGIRTATSGTSLSSGTGVRPLGSGTIGSGSTRTKRPASATSSSSFSRGSRKRG